MSRVDVPGKTTSLEEVRAALLLQIEGLSIELREASRAIRNSERDLAVLEFLDKNREKIRIVCKSIDEYLKYGGLITGFHGVLSEFGKEKFDMLGLSDPRWLDEAQEIRKGVEGFSFLPEVKNYLLQAIPTTRPFRSPGVSISVVGSSGKPLGGRFDRSARTRREPQVGAFDKADEAVALGRQVRVGLSAQPPHFPVAPTTNPPAPLASAESAANPPAPLASAESATNPPASLASAESAANPPATLAFSEVTENLQPTAPVGGAVGEDLKASLDLAGLRESLEQKTCFSWLLSLIQPGRREAKLRFLSELDGHLAADQKADVLDFLRTVKGWPEYSKVIAGYCSRVVQVIANLEALLNPRQISSAVSPEELGAPEMRPGSSNSG